MPFGLFRRAPSSTQLIHDQRYSEAVAAAERVLERNPRATREWMNKGMALTFLGQYEVALDAFKHVQGVAARAGLWSVELRALFALKHFEEAFELAQRSLSHNSQAGWAWNDMGVALANLNRGEEALACYERSLGIDARRGHVWGNQGRALLSVGLDTLALAAIERALALDANNAPLWSDKGRCLLRLQRYEGALVAVEHAISLSANNAEYWRLKGAALSWLARYEDALHAYHQALVINPQLAAAWLDSGAALHGLERYAEALDACEHMLELDPHLVKGWVNKADYLRHLERYDEAMGAVEQGRGINADDATVESMAGRILSDQGRYDEARVAFDRALALDPNRRNTWIALGDMHTARGEHEPALAAFERALAIGPADSHIAEQRDAALRALGRAAEIGSATSTPMSAPEEPLLATWTEPARQVLSLAKEEAMRLGAPRVGDEHLLLGLLGVPNGMAASVLRDLGVQLDAARDAVRKLPLRPAGSGPDGAAGAEIGMGQRARDAIAGAVAQARGNKHDYVATQHLLLALSELKDARTRDVWLLLGIKPTRMYRATLSAMNPT